MISLFVNAIALVEIVYCSVGLYINKNLKCSHFYDIIKPMYRFCIERRTRL